MAIRRLPNPFAFYTLFADGVTRAAARDAEPDSGQPRPLAPGPLAARARPQWSGDTTVHYRCASK